MLLRLIKCSSELTRTASDCLIVGVNPQELENQITNLEASIDLLRDDGIVTYVKDVRTCKKEMEKFEESVSYKKWKEETKEPPNPLGFYYDFIIDALRDNDTIPSFKLRELWRRKNNFETINNDEWEKSLKAAKEFAVEQKY